MKYKLVNLRLKYFDLIPTNTNQSCRGHSAASLGENMPTAQIPPTWVNYKKCGKFQNNLENQENVEEKEKVKLKSNMIMVTSEWKDLVNNKRVRVDEPQ